jgi:hypothetical protein
MKAALVLLLTACVNANVLRASSSDKAPLRLDGADCADPGPGLPKYCCDGIMPAKDYVGSCECNPGWTHKECICKGYLTQNACHHCMVHLPGTNRWLKSFSEKELYDNCDDCVSRCKADFDKGDCKDFIGDVFGAAFPNSSPEQVLCTNDYLKSQVMQDDYPINLKRSLYKAPKFGADDEYHQPSDWAVAGVGAKR